MARVLQTFGTPKKNNMELFFMLLTGDANWLDEAEWGEGRGLFLWRGKFELVCRPLTDTKAILLEVESTEECCGLSVRELNIQ